MEGIFVIGSMCACAVLIVSASLFYHYKKEQMRAQERLAAIEKGIAPKDLFANGDNNNNVKACSNRRESEIFGGIKVLIIGLFLALALYYATGSDHFSMQAAVWGLFVAGVGLAKIVVGLLMKKEVRETPES